MKRTKNILLLANSAWYIWNFRLEKIKYLQRHGYSITVISPYNKKYTELLIANSINFLPWNLDGLSINPFKETQSIIQLVKYLHLIKAAAIFTYTPKANIYTDVVGLFFPNYIINNISGMGELFIKKSLLQIFIKGLYRFIIKKRYYLFFQNNTDMDLFVLNKIVYSGQYQLIPGSGVDVNRFSPPKYRRKDDVVKYIFSGRLLKQKGIYDYIDAIKILNAHNMNAKYFVLGMVNPLRNNSVSYNELDNWINDDLIEYLGEVDNVEVVLKKMDCLVFPSYYGEGVPRSILEASSTELAVITTDHPGCRDAVIDGHTGFICKPMDPSDLAKKMIQFLDLTKEQRNKLGVNGRAKMKNEFSERLIISAYHKKLQNV